ncbi:dipeptidyl peptidase 1-like isoform X2 [Homarus americanus]|uniref:dipeptidyl peptidase 1-like isoform X1 n=1 Tax=Homarus americanus TaxID=6706 RepID=UPI001C4509A6|nr:dipeptidyl peptidase 1-like isoform X1 [Homarus americanus]XP_042217949.1 dipeptidyl peptidase 1-like isoform X2 [Homarus americanus]
MLTRVVLALCCVAVALADTPANCLYEDVRGTWTFSETERTGDHTINCDELGPIVHTKTFTLSFPNVAKDELNNEGTWTMIYNQGFEVNINERSYFAFSYYEGDMDSAVSYCDRTFSGWSRDKTIRNWSCYTAQKLNKTAPRVTYNNLKALSTRLYKNDHKMIEDINASQSSWRGKAYLQHESYTVEEMYRRAGGRRTIRHIQPKPAPASPEQKRRVAALPENFDWRDVDGENYVSDVRDQGACGSCYIFSSMGMMEARVRIATRNQRQDVFSPQDVVTCSKLSQGCEGGFEYLVAGRYAQDQGIVAEKCNPYKAEDGPCNRDLSCELTYVSEYDYVGGFFGACNEEVMMLALVENGPITLAFMVYDDFMSYSGGIYHHTGLSNGFNPLEDTNHGVLLVGYGVEAETGEKFWSVKNSWGPKWGEEGYFRVRRGTDECGVESEATQVTVIP